MLRVWTSFTLCHWDLVRVFNGGSNKVRAVILEQNRGEIYRKEREATLDKFLLLNKHCGLEIIEDEVERYWQ